MNFSISNLLKAQAIVNAKYAKPEMRLNTFPAFMLLTANDGIIRDVVSLRTREDRAIEAHMMTRTRRAPGSERLHNHTGTRGDSMKVELGWTSKSDTYTISIKQMENNLFSFEQALANGLEQCCINILEAKETEAIAWLQAQRTKVSRTLKGMSFNTGTDTVDVKAADKARFFQFLKSALKQNNHRGGLDVITDNLMALDAEWLAAQGSGNNQNTAFQFYSGMRLVESNDLQDDNYGNGVVIAMPTETACALNWIPQKNRNGYGDYNSFVGGYGTFQFMGYTFALHGYAQRADTSGSNGDKQDVVLEFELSLDTSFNRAPLSDPDESTIFQVGLSA